MRAPSGLLCLVAFVPLSAACGGRPPAPDVTFDSTPYDAPCTTCVDAHDVAVPDGDSGAIVDAVDTGPIDAATVDVLDGSDATADATDVATDVHDGGILIGPCTTVGAPLMPLSEARSLSRPIWVGTTATGFAAGYRANLGGLDNVYFERVGTDGSFTGATNLSQNVFALVEGGAFAFDGTNVGMVYSSNEMGGLDVYFARTTPAGLAVGTPQRVLADTQVSELAQVAPRTGGWLAVWRSTDDTMGTVALKSQALDASGGAVGTPNTITPLGAAPGSFRLVSSATNIAVVYVDQQPLTGNVYALGITTSGSAAGAPVELSMGALSTDGVGAALTGTQLTAAWTDAGSSGTLHLRQLEVASGVPGARHDLPSIGTNVSKVGLAVDGTGFAVAMRVPWMAGGSTAMLRLDAALAPRDGLSRVGSSGGGDRVDIAARGDGTYIVGWSDATSTMTTGTLQVMRCP